MIYFKIDDDDFIYAKLLKGTLTGYAVVNVEELLKLIPNGSLPLTVMPEYALKAIPFKDAK